MESQARHPSTVSERAERDLASIGPAIRFGAAVAGQYDAGRALPAEVMEALHWQIVDAAGLAPGAAVVDVGAGTGALAGPFLRDSFSYVGLDASGAMLRQFHAAYHRALQAVPQVVQADLLALPLQDSSFDLVLAFRVFGVVRGWRRGIRECLRVLRTGGHLIAGRVERGPGSLHEIVRSERNRLLEQAGSQTRRPGGDDSAVVQTLAAEAEFEARLGPVAWTVRTTPRRILEQNLTGWRIQALPPAERDELRSRLSAALTARCGSLDSEFEEPAAVMLHSFRKR